MQRINQCLVWETWIPNPGSESPVFHVDCDGRYIKHYLTLGLVKENDGHFYYCLSQRKTSNRQLSNRGSKFTVLVLGNVVLAGTTFKPYGILWRMKESDILKYGIYRNRWKFNVIFNSKIINFLEQKEDKSSQTSLHLDPLPCLESLSKDLSMMLDEGSPYDLELKSENQTIKAHKNVLCSRSEVFATMLHADMKEGRSGVVEIEDMDSDELMYFVKYLYTGSLPDLATDTTMNLYEAGDKYAVKSLMERCSCSLIEKLKNENACAMLDLAYRHNDHDFKEKVIAFILERKISLQGGPWQCLWDKHPKLVIEVLTRFASSNIAEECKCNNEGKRLKLSS